MSPSSFPGAEELGRAGHSTVVHGQYMWVYGGYRFRDGQVIVSGAPDIGSSLLEAGSPDDLVRFVVVLPIHL